MIRPRFGCPLALLALLAPLALLAGCDRGSGSPSATPPSGAPALAETPAPVFRNVASATSYVGDATCVACHAGEAAAYARHNMAKSFHRWTAATRVEPPLDSALYHPPTGLSYSVEENAGRLFQVEFVARADGSRLHELRRRIDYVMGSGHVARTYFTEENGRLFQLPLTWYNRHGWDFSPGYTANNARFDRVLPDRCIACHSSYPQPLPYLEGKFAELRPGIGCERCHGPGALHVAERGKTGGAPRPDSAFDNSIVNPARLPLARRLDVCEQCHVHTSVSVLREGKDAFSYMPSQPLRDQWAFFKIAGSIDIVSHADRLRQSPCFLATQATTRPLECATCHAPHQPPPDSAARNAPCLGCHLPAQLPARVARAARADHAAGANCVGCHMPKVAERGIPHGTFTEHWIRVARAAPAVVSRASGQPIEPFFERDRGGRDAPVYQAMGKIVYATLATDLRTMADAAAELGRALGGDSGRADARFLLGVAHEQVGRVDEAVLAFQQAVRGDSMRPEHLRALAQAYRRAGRGGDTVDALYRRALAIQPALAWIRAEYAGYLQERGRRDEAERAYRDALEEQPGNAAGWFNLGTLLAEQGRRAQSTDAFREAVRLDPMLAQALTPLIAVRAAGDAVTAVESLGTPLTSLPLRDRGPRAARTELASDGTAALVFLNVPPGGLVQLFTPDGTPVRTLRMGQGIALPWDLRTDAGRVISSGLYRVRVQGGAAAGRVNPPQTFFVGLVRAR
jgi:hypothetical protein